MVGAQRTLLGTLPITPRKQCDGHRWVLPDGMDITKVLDCNTQWMIRYLVSIQFEIYNIRANLQLMTQPPPTSEDINIEEVLKMFNMVKGCTGYIVFNTEGIPIKKSPNITPEKALHKASLVQDLWNVTRKVVVNDLKSPDNALEVIRMRTKHYYEYIITQSPTGEVTLMATQNCVVNEPQKAIENKEVPKEAVKEQP